VVGPLQEILGADAEIGRIRASLIPPRLEVGDLSVTDASGKQAVSIRRVRVYINPIPLLVKKIWLPLISILEPRVYTERAKDGTINLALFIERIKSNLVRVQSEGPSRYGLILGSITVRQGHVEF
jgi:uncharacterized protein involved in outer membrane biogenesis